MTAGPPGREIQMNNRPSLEDIIKSDEDRLFIVDPECYIIFTGVSVDDIQPFIRIGNWYDMPVEIIPLIENIIVTDRLIGNPSFEQFNIDITRLSTNRYIGSKSIINRFLQYQELFGVKLNQAVLVEVERDIPELSQEKNISEKYQFIGVFYRDGNFKTVYNSKPLVDLNRLEEETISFNGMLDEVAKHARKKDLYRNSGVVVLDHNPAFFHRGSFHTYMFPSRYVESFSRLTIRPDSIRSVFLPSENLISISNFLKWNNRRESKISLFHDRKQNVEIMRKLFPKATITRADFSGLTHKADRDFTVQNYRNSYNLKCSYTGVSGSKSGLTLSYVKSRKGVEDVIKDHPDLILIQYSAYEDSSLLFKSNEIPVGIIDDGNPNLSRLRGKDFTILYPEKIYEFHRAGSMEECVSLINLEKDLYQSYIENPEGWIRETFGSIGGYETIGEPEIPHLHNLKSFVRLLINTTVDRKLSKELKDLYRELEKKSIETGELISSVAQINLIVFDRNIYQGVTSISKNGPLFLEEISGEALVSAADISPETRKFYERIIHDRERLMRLLAVFMESSKHFADNEKVNRSLRNIIEERKRHFREDLDFDLDRVAVEDVSVSAESGITEPGDARKKKIKRTAFSLTGLLLLFLLLIGGLNYRNIRQIISGNGTEGDDEYFDKKKIETLNREHNITVDDNTIYEYANAVAVKNGYKPIARYEKKVNNPDWIYPGNVFVMLDGQKVVVRDGDTLWDLAKYKLIQMKIEFTALIEKIEKAEGEEKAGLIDKAKELAFTKKQKEIVTVLKSSLNSSAENTVAD